MSDDEYDLAPQAPPALPRQAGHNFVRPVPPVHPSGHGYVRPAAPHPAVAAATITSALAVRADGKNLLVRRGAALPERCIKCNEPAAAMVKVTLAQSESDAGTAMAGFLPYVGGIFRIIWLVGQIRTRDAHGMQVGLCARHRTHRWVGYGILAAALPVSAFVFYLAAKDDFRYYPRLPVVAIVVFVLMLLVGWAMQRTLSVVNMDHRLLVLRGAGQPFLDSLPTPATVQAPRTR
jgi:hypothetical protein